MTVRGLMTRRTVTGTGLVVVLGLTASGCSAAAEVPSPAASSPARSNAAGATTQTTRPRSTPPGPTSATRPGSVGKVLVFITENHSLSQMRSQMPYAFGLARRFGYATAYTAIRHPSLPNYIAIASGQTHGISNDDSPSANPVRGESVFGQAVASGKAATVYADGMPQNCATADGGSGYAVKHNPWAYFINERGTCQKLDVPVGQLGQAITRGTLPDVGMVIPNLCHDAHDCPLGVADTWFKGWMTTVFQGADWKSGHLAVVLTADEDDHSAGNTVLTVVIHPSLRAKVVTTGLTHYSLTRLYEEVAGLPYLSGAATAPSMAAAFGLPLNKDR
jgi:phosphatidylinositol-3-phosphatase